MKTLVSEIYSGASASISVSIVADAPYKRLVAVDNTGSILCDIHFENLLIKHWCRTKTTCDVVSSVANPGTGHECNYARVSQFILRKHNNDEEKKTYYTMEVCSYV